MNLLKRQEVAAKLSVHPGTVLNLRDRGELTPVGHIPHLIGPDAELYDPADVLAIIEEVNERKKLVTQALVDGFLVIGRAAESAECSVAHIRRGIRAGKITRRRLYEGLDGRGRRSYVRMTDVDEWAKTAVRPVPSREPYNIDRTDYFSARQSQLYYKVPSTTLWRLTTEGDRKTVYVPKVGDITVFRADRVRAISASPRKGGSTERPGIHEDEEGKWWTVSMTFDETGIDNRTLLTFCRAKSCYLLDGRGAAKWRPAGQTRKLWAKKIPNPVPGGQPEVWVIHETEVPLLKSGKALLDETGKVEYVPRASEAPRTPTDSQSKQRKSYARDHFFLDLYRFKCSAIYHSHAKIRDFWNSLPLHERGRICPGNPHDVTRKVVMSAIDRAKADS